MDLVFVFGDNQISQFLKSSLKSRGYFATGPKSKLKAPVLMKLLAIIDLANAEKPYPSLSNCLLDIKNLIDLAVKKSAPYIFVYKEGNNSKRNLPLANAIDFIHQYASLTGCCYAVVQTDDIYGKNINTSSILAGYLKLLISGRAELDVSNDLNDIYLLHENDLAKGIINIINETAGRLEGKNYTLLPEEPITELELAHFIAELADLELIIRHKIDKVPLQEFKSLDVGTFYPDGWKPEVTLESGILELFESMGIPTPGSANEEESLEQVRLMQEAYIEEGAKRNAAELKKASFLKKAGSHAGTKKTEKSRVKHNAKIPVKAQIAVLAAVLLISLLIPSVVFIRNLFFGFNYLKLSVQNIQELDIALASENSRKAEEYLAKVKNPPLGIYPIFITAKAGIEDFSALADTAANINELAGGLSKTSLNAIIENKTLALNRPFVLGDSTQPNSRSAFDRSVELTDISINSINSIETDILFIKNQLNFVSGILQNGRTRLTDLKNINPVLPAILGFHGPRRYLLLLQNPDELRAIGGSITSYGVIETNQGEIKVLKVNDISTLDEQLELNSVNITSPLPVRKASGRDQTTISDSGWDPDYTANAKKIAYFYKMASGEDVDGVIAVNLAFVRTYLGKETAAYTDNPTKLASLFFEKIANNTIDYRQLIQSIYTGLSSKEILVYDKNESVLSSVLKNNWAGAIQNQADDYLYVLDSNIGRNSANRHIGRFIQYDGFQPQKDSGYVRKVYITYTNTVSADSGPKEDYLNYLRVIVPGDSRLNYARITTNGEEKNITPNVEIASYAKKAVYSAELLVKTGETTMVTFEYESLNKDHAQHGIKLLVQKQPGSGNDPIKATLAYPAYPAQTNKNALPVGAVLSHSAITYSSSLNEDKIFEFPP